MPRVVVAAEAGACFGVERALRMVAELAEHAHASGEPVCTLGPLIHNPLVVAELSHAGVGVADNPAQARPGSTLVLRTHGVAPSVEDEARSLGLAVVDATCPFVKRVHLAVERLAQEGYTVVVAGEKGHPEVEGTLGHAPGALVAGSAAEVADLELGRKVGVVAQTTLAMVTLREVVGALVGRCEELRLVNTICDATSKRQAAAAELAQQADVMLVVGGRNSANTAHLAAICADRCARTHLVECADELDTAWFEGAELVGITAGASTPASHIAAVREAAVREAAVREAAVREAAERRDAVRG